MPDDLQDTPSRKELREALKGFAARDTARAIRIFLLDAVLFLAGVACVAGPLPLAWKLAASPLIALAIIRLFVLGHDLCHQSFTDHRRLNRILGRAAFLPSLTPYSLWEIGHNLSHHGFTNLGTSDHVWRPFSQEQFAALPRGRQWLERFYRSGFGHWLYYLREEWWHRLFFPRLDGAGVRPPAFARDGALVAAFLVSWIAVLAGGAVLTDASVPLNLLVGLVLPFLAWNQCIGLVIYLHHTDPDVPWHDDAARWARSHPQLASTIRVKLPRPWGPLLHNIMEHPAHHVDMTIPLYRLRQAQRRLEELAPRIVVRRTLSWSSYWRCARLCKTYDFASRTWHPFPEGDLRAVAPASAPARR